MASEGYKEFAFQMKQYLTDHLRSDGYDMVDEKYVMFENRQPSFSDFIVLFTGEDEPQKRFSTMIECFRKLNIIEQYWEAYKLAPLKIKGSTFFTIVANGYEHDPSTFELKNVTRVEIPSEGYSINKVGDSHIDYWRHRFKPWLDHFSNIRNLNSQVNKTVEYLGSPLSTTGVWYHKMIIAKLAGDPIYEQIYGTFKGKLVKALETHDAKSEKYKGFLWVLEQLYAKLKDVPPLENPMVI